ncbi:bifunctional epoxide hydrolase 2-like [Impatiens glandulifera]|uniref:bifunctional epoxide hydrolase 2-like n=1 Tax=Impatiens glandulifera TaxID=253017 RepID=UPI001FB05C94|nr:bifunctional epoxide hydrolase 2-like [Impatiens glandulifera]
MDEIKHNLVSVNGLKIHVAEIGSGPDVIMFLHGFPEIWYSWRHQMIAAAAAGYRAIAPDYRGYGLSDPTPQPDKASFMDFLSDLIALLDLLHIHKVFVVGKDFGAPLAYLLAFFQPNKVSAVITLGLPFLRSLDHHDALPEGFYVKRFQEPGRAEADFGRFDARTVVRTIYILFSKSDIPIAKEDQEIMDMVDPLHDPLPSWFSDKDLDVYGDLYGKSGFQTALQATYRWMQIKQSGKGMGDVKIESPSLLIMGEKDYVLKFLGMEDYIKNGEAKMIVPNLEVIFVPEGTHFIQEQFPHQVNQLILTFLEKQKSKS